MHEPNPFASPPRVEAPHPRSGSADLRASAVPPLIPLWTWLAVSFVFAFAITPADPVSLLLVLGFNLILLWQGALLATRNAGTLGIMKTACGVIGMMLWVYLLYLSGVGVVIAALYVAAGSAAGAWCWRSIPRGRLTIFTCFSLGYVLGTPLALVGFLPGAVLGSIWGQKMVRQRRGERAG